VISSSASRRRYKIENPPLSLKGCIERPDEYERAVKHWALLEADERNKNALPPGLWVFSLSQAAIEGVVSVRFQSLVTMELAVTDAMWHGHAGIDKWIGLVWTESKIDQSKIASGVASKLNRAVVLERALKAVTRIRSTSSSSIGEPRQLRTRLPSPSTICSPA
jgi:hypothetical protein